MLNEMKPLSGIPAPGLSCVAIRLAAPGLSSLRVWEGGRRRRPPFAALLLSPLGEAVASALPLLWGAVKVNVSQSFATVCRLQDMYQAGNGAGCHALSSPLAGAERARSRWKQTRCHDAEDVVRSARCLHPAKEWCGAGYRERRKAGG